MSARLTLVCHAPTAATATGAFAADEPLDRRGSAWAADAAGAFARAPERAVSAPAPACRQTAAALGLRAGQEPAVRDWDLGRWRGRTLDQVLVEDPDGVRAWLGDPGATPHGGEPLTGLLARVEAWLAGLPAAGHTVAVTGSAVVRAAVVATLHAPPAGFWRVDVAPLTATELRGGPGRWTLRSSGRALHRPG